MEDLWIFRVSFTKTTFVWVDSIQGFNSSLHKGFWVMSLSKGLLSFLEFTLCLGRKKTSFEKSSVPRRAFGSFTWPVYALISSSFLGGFPHQFIILSTILYTPTPFRPAPCCPLTLFVSRDSQGPAGLGCGTKDCRIRAQIIKTSRVGYRNLTLS